MLGTATAAGLSSPKPQVEPVKKSHLLLEQIVVELEGMNTNLEEQVSKQNAQILAELKETNRNLGILARAMLTLSEQLSAADSWVKKDDKVTIAEKLKAKGKS